MENGMIAILKEANAFHVYENKIDGTKRVWAYKDIPRVKKALDPLMKALVEAGLNQYAPAPVETEPPIPVPSPEEKDIPEEEDL